MEESPLFCRLEDLPAGGEGPSQEPSCCLEPLRLRTLAFRDGQSPQLWLRSDRLDSRLHCPQPGTILMGYPPLLLLRELSRWLPIPAVDNRD